MRRNLSRVLKQKSPALKRLFASNPRVLGIFLFGSQADGTAMPRSDIDLAALFDRAITWDDELTFQVAVSDVLKTDDVDVVNLNRASLLFRFRAIQGELLYERDFVRVSDFIEETMIKYRDYDCFIKNFNEDYFAGMRQDYAQFGHSPYQRAKKNNRKQLARTPSAAR